MRLTGLIVLCTLLLLTAVAPTKPAFVQSNPAPIVARVTLRTEAELARFVTLGLDLLELREGADLFILTTPEQIAELRASGWQITVDEAQTQLLAGSFARRTFLDGYRTIAEMRQLLDAQAAQFPALAEVFVYGQSWEKQNSNGARGHDLFGIHLTNKAIPGPKPTFFLFAGIHARELATSELALRLVDYLLRNYGVNGDATWLLNEQQITIVPLANPDGRVLAEQGHLQRKNTNTSYGGNCLNPPTSTNQFGVDLNRNSSFRWGLINLPGEPVCGGTFPGAGAASEPETAALERLIRSLFPDQRGPNDTDAAPADATGLLLSLHSYGNLVLWPWGSERGAAPNGAELEMIGGKLANYNEYAPQQSIRLYPTSGTTDEWAYGELGVASFTFEVGPSGGPCSGFFAPFNCLDENREKGGAFWARNLPALLYAARVARAPYQLAQGPAPESVTVAPLGLARLGLRAQFDERANGNQAIVAAEYFIDAPGGEGRAMTAEDGSFDSASETAVATLDGVIGKRLLYVRAQDAAGNWGPLRAVLTTETAARTVPPRGTIARPLGGRVVQP